MKKLIIGVDEAGRGPLAGPVVAAAVVVLDKNFKIIGLRDSKQLTPQKREEVFRLIKDNPSIKWAVARVSERVIDKINILQATRLAMARAVRKLVKGFSEKEVLVIVDGNVKIPVNFPQKTVIKGDEKVFACKLASIFAKVTRDRIMIRYDKKYPQYLFKKHKGYPTKEHIMILRKVGLSAIHRKFALKLVK